MAVWTGDTASPDLCPGGNGLHSPADPELHLPYYSDITGPPSDDPHNQSGWRSCVTCHGLVYTYIEDRFAGAVPRLVSTRVVPGLPPTAAEYGLVILGWGWKDGGGGDFRLAWMPLFPGSPPRLRDTMYYTGDPSVPWSPDAGQAKDLWCHYDYTSIGFTWLDQMQRWLLLTTNARDLDPVPGGDDARARPIVARLAPTPWELATATAIPIFDPTADYTSQP